MASPTLKIMVVAGLAAAFSASAAFAHHSYAAFDRTKTATLVGTVSEVEWTNPHTWFFLKAPGPNGGALTDWAVEGDPPGGMIRAGWVKASVKPGDKITIVMNPMVTGQLGGHYVSATFANGVTVGRHSDQK